MAYCSMKSVSVMLECNGKQDEAWGRGKDALRKAVLAAQWLWTECIVLCLHCTKLTQKPDITHANTYRDVGTNTSFTNTQAHRDRHRQQGHTPNDTQIDAHRVCRAFCYFLARFPCFRSFLLPLYVLATVFDWFLAASQRHCRCCHFKSHSCPAHAPRPLAVAPFGSWLVKRLSKISKSHKNKLKWNEHTHT